MLCVKRNGTTSGLSNVKPYILLAGGCVAEVGGQSRIVPYQRDS